MVSIVVRIVLIDFSYLLSGGIVGLIVYWNSVDFLGIGSKKSAL